MFLILVVLCHLLFVSLQFFHLLLFISLNIYFSFCYINSYSHICYVTCTYFFFMLLILLFVLTLRLCRKMLVCTLNIYMCECVFKNNEIKNLVEMRKIVIFWILYWNWTDRQTDTKTFVCLSVCMWDSLYCFNGRQFVECNMCGSIETRFINAVGILKFCVILC